MCSARCCNNDNATKTPLNIYYDKDCNADLIKGKAIAVIGYGSQGHAHALNLKDSGAANVVIGLRDGSGSAPKAEAAGFTVKNPADAVTDADVVMVLVPMSCKPISIVTILSLLSSKALR